MPGNFVSKNVWLKKTRPGSRPSLAFDKLLYLTRRVVVIINFVLTISDGELGDAPVIDRHGDVDVRILGNDAADGRAVGGNQ